MLICPKSNNVEKRVNNLYKKEEKYIYFLDCNFGEENFSKSLEEQLQKI